MPFQPEHIFEIGTSPEMAFNPEDWDGPVAREQDSALLSLIFNLQIFLTTEAEYRNVILLITRSLCSGCNSLQRGRRNYHS